MKKEDWTELNEKSHYIALQKQDIENRKLIKKLILEKEALKQQLKLCDVSCSKRVEFTQDTYLSDGLYEIETDKGRTFKAEYTLGRWFEYMVEIEPNEKIVAYYS